MRLKPLIVPLAFLFLSFPVYGARRDLREEARILWNALLSHDSSESSSSVQGPSNQVNEPLTDEDLSAFVAKWDPGEFSDHGRQPHFTSRLGRAIQGAIIHLETARLQQLKNDAFSFFQVADANLQKLMAWKSLTDLQTAKNYFYGHNFRYATELTNLIDRLKEAYLELSNEYNVKGKPSVVGRPLSSAEHRFVSDKRSSELLETNVWLYKAVATKEAADRWMERNPPGHGRLAAAAR